MSTLTNLLALVLGIVLIGLSGACSTSTAGPAEASAAVPAPSGVINWWPGNGDGRDVVNGNNVRLVNADYAPGLVGSAFNFTAANHSYAITTNRNPRWAFGPDMFTIELWVKFRSWQPTGIDGEPDATFLGVDEGPYNMRKWFFGVNMGRLTFHINAPNLGPVWLVNAPFTPELDQWYHLALVRQEDLFTVYINGNAAGSQRFPDFMPARKARLTIGQTGGLGYDIHGKNAGSQRFRYVMPAPDAPLTIGQTEGLGYVDGLLDEVTIYGRALRADEIQSIYEAGKAGKVSY